MFSLRLNNARAGINQPAVRPAPRHRHWLTARPAVKLLAKTSSLPSSIGQSRYQSRLYLPPPCPPPASAPKDIASTATESRERARGGGAEAGPVRRGPRRLRDRRVLKGLPGAEGPTGAEGTPSFPRPFRPARCAQTVPREGRATPWRAVTQCLTSQQLCYK